MDWAMPVTMREHQLLHDTMAELDNMLGCRSFEWVVDRNIRWEDSVILSGAAGPQSRVWRITPARPAEFRRPLEFGMAMRQKRDIATPGTLTFPVSLGLRGRQSPCSIAFHNATLQRSNVSNFGWWISQLPSAAVAVNCSTIGLLTTWPLPKHVQ